MPCWDHNAKKSPPFRRVFALWPQGPLSIGGAYPLQTSLRRLRLRKRALAFYLQNHHPPRPHQIAVSRRSFPSSSRPFPDTIPECLVSRTGHGRHSVRGGRKPSGPGRGLVSRMCLRRHSAGGDRKPPTLERVVVPVMCPGTMSGTGIWKPSNRQCNQRCYLIRKQ